METPSAIPALVVLVICWILFVGFPYIRLFKALWPVKARRLIAVISFVIPSTAFVIAQFDREWPFDEGVVRFVWGLGVWAFAFYGVIFVWICWLALVFLVRSFNKRSE